MMSLRGGDALFEGLPEDLQVLASHVESVLELPPGAVLLGSTALDPNHVYRIGQRAWGVQFHPEFDADITRGYIAGRRELLLKEGLDPSALGLACKDSEHGSAVLARFAEIVVRVAAD